MKTNTPKGEVEQGIWDKAKQEADTKSHNRLSTERRYRELQEELTTSTVERTEQIIGEMGVLNSNLDLLYEKKLGK